MPLAPSSQLLAAATRGRTGVAAFNVITLEYAEAIVAGAETTGRPVILQLSENAAKFHGGRLRPIAAAMRELADAASVAVSLHLDHVEDEDLLRLSAEAGFSSVMFDGGRLPYAENVRATTAAAEWAHGQGMIIEAELGYVGGKDTQVTSAHESGVRTDPQQAAEFVAATGVDALAVAVGSSHAMHSRTAVLDDELIGRLTRAISGPLVLHGSSGVADADLRRAVEAGVTKVNVGTILSIAYTEAVKSHLADSPRVSDPRTYLAPARISMSRVVSDLLRVITADDASPPTSI
jgi:fructose-bisphosphate aldolase class II